MFNTQNIKRTLTTQQQKNKIPNSKMGKGLSHFSKDDI